MITEEQIWSYLDGSLSVTDRKEVELAIAGDKQSVELYQEISALHQTLKSETLLKPSANFSAMVMAALAASAPQIQAKISLKLALMFVLPTILVIAAFAGVLTYYHIPVSYQLPVHFSMSVLNHVRLYIVIADVLLLAFFWDALSEYRFNRKALFS